MRLARPFFQLPVLFDPERLQHEVLALPDDAWVPHPHGIPGNSAARLITAGGGQNDDHSGQMLPTCWLHAMPYAKQVLASFGVVWSRSRLMRLAPGVGVPEHADIHYHWHTRVRMHVPVFTTPQVLFHCDGQTVHMAPGEAWIFDNWRRHHVENAADRNRIHLVADTSGTSEFWQMTTAPAPLRERWPLRAFDSRSNLRLLTEAGAQSPIMPAAEVQLLLEDLCAELHCGNNDTGMLQRKEQLSRLLLGFAQDWRQLCALHGTDGKSIAAFSGMVGALANAARPLGQGLSVRTNSADALLVLEKRVLQNLVRPELN